MTSGRIQGVSPKIYKGVKYRSTLEADTAQTLDLLGIPFKYEDRRITLLEGFDSKFQERKVTHITYTPDFEVGNIILECKGFETPEWKIKKKLVYKYLEENEPNTKFYLVKDCRKSLMEALDENWTLLGYAIEVISKKRDPKDKKNPYFNAMFSSLEDAMTCLSLTGKSKGVIIHSLTKKREYVYGYKWKLTKISL